ncbi:MAG: amidohydrolase family protein, partial [Candidatus Acidiferrum sp.]
MRNTVMVILAATMALSYAVIIGRAADEKTYELVIANGRVMDPESGMDAVRNVGISGGKIRAISSSPLQGKTSLDAKGLVVAPGFIDMHEHGQEPKNYQFQAHDGVTTSLELELGTADVNGWYAKREGKSLINFGVSIGHIPVRMKVMHDPGTFLPTGEAAHREATPKELEEISADMDKGFREGAVAEGMGVNYTAGATHWEIVQMFKIAARYKASVHVHLRYAGIKEPATGLAALEEVLAAAASTGAPLHVVHVTSMGLKFTPELISMIEGARQHGLDVTTECYPYTAASTELESTIFDPGWQESMGITYKDLQWAETGERLNAETFEKYRKKGGAVIIYSIPEGVARAAVANPIVMIASDGMPITGPRVHPRGQGTFSRVLGYYV